MIVSETIFVGQFVNNVISGAGLVFIQNGDMYEGELQEGEISGRGRMTYIDGVIHEGQFLGGKRDGPGETFLKQDEEEVEILKRKGTSEDVETKTQIG